LVIIRTRTERLDAVAVLHGVIGSRSVKVTSHFYLALGCGVGCPGFESLQGLGIFLSATVSGSALGPAQPPVPWVSGALSLGMGLAVRLRLVPRSGAAWSCASTPPMRLSGVVLGWSTGTALPLCTF
jgi:hypothetical protein